MNPDFDYLLWARELDYGFLSLVAGVAGEHVAHDGRLCCRGRWPAYEITITAWDGKGWASRKLSEVPL